jgi:hypothetical protein
MSHYKPHRSLVVLVAVLGLAVLAIAPAALSNPASGEAAAINVRTGLLAQVITPPDISVTATDAAASEEGPGTGTFTINRAGDLTGAITVNYSLSGTAGGGDYQALSGSVNFAVSQTTATVTVTPIDDSEVEGDETVILTVIAGTGYAIGSPSSATVTIADNDPPVVSIVASDPNASETAGDTGTFTITRTGPTTGALAVSYTISGTAAAGDYSPMLTGSVQIPAGETSVTIVVTPVDDNVAEGSETLILTISVNAAYAIGASGSATVTISDNDLPAVNIQATDPNAAEAGSNSGEFTISRTGPTTAALTVVYNVTGTASQSDYNPILSGSVVIPAGSVSTTIVITPVDDAIDEANETVILTLGTSGLYTVGANNSATVTIADNDGDDQEPPPAIDRSEKEQCKKGGWRNMGNLAFKNQGDCVSYFATGGKNPPNG